MLVALGTFITPFMTSTRGLTFLSAVPPTVGLGGRVFEATVNCDGVWYLDIVLAVDAALIHWPIREAVVVRAQTV